MTDAHRPGPHPRLESIRSRPAPDAGPVRPRPQPSVRPAPVASRPVPAIPRPEPVDLIKAASQPHRFAAEAVEADDDLPLSRAERRRAERDAGRQMVARRALQAATLTLVAIVVVSLVMLVMGNRSTSTGHPAARSSPTVTGANLADPGLVTAFLSSGGTDIAAVTTYDYRSLDDALNAGLAVTTGKYRAAYRAAMTGDLARTATAEHVIHTFEVLDIGIGQISADGRRAKVLVFGRQRITDDRTGSRTDVSPMTLTATIQRDGNRYRISDLAEGADPGLPPGGPDLDDAAEAGRAEVTSTLSYRRDSFDADLQAAVDGATSPLREQLKHEAAATQRAMINGKFDMTAAVTATAVVRADTDTVTLLVAATETREGDDASTPIETHRRYEVTVTRTLDGWAASRITSVDGGS
jgi:hypothetical protein